MSGILDALFQRFGGMDYSSHAAQSIDQPATHQIEDADSSSIEPATVEKKRVHQDTPHPGSKVSFSSNSRQSSLRAQSIFPQSPPLEAVDGGAVQVHPSLPPPSPLDLASPPRTDRIVSDTSYTSVSVNTSSDFSTPAELIFPPQSLPFVLRRRAVTTAVDFTPSKAQDNTLIAHLRRTSLNPVIVQDYSEGEDDDVDIQVPENPAHQHQIVGDERVASVSVKLSSWREEQIKYTKRARRGPDTAPKPIPTLHGPLSLPYARNPSGVDATIADESTYLSHVFGLRAAGTARSASNTTNSSNTTRSTSSGDRPLVERDPYQNIGIRKGVAADRLSGVGHGNEKTPSSAQTTPASKHIVSLESSSPVARTGTASAILRAQLSSSGTKLTPIPGSPSIDSQAAFRAFFDEIPRLDKSNPLRQSDLDLPSDRAHQRGTSAPLPPRSKVVIHGDPLLNMSGLLQAPHASQIGDDLGNDAHPRVSSNESQPSSQDDHSHAQATKGSAAATAAASKADASANWRRKAQQDQSAVVQSTIVASAPSTPRVPSDPVAPDVMTIDKLFAKFEKQQQSPSIAFTPAPSPVDSVKLQTPPLDIVRQPVSRRPSPAKAVSSPVRSPVEPLGEGKGKATNVSTPTTVKASHTPLLAKNAVASSSKMTLAKGTPGAGKLLKRQPSMSPITKEKAPAVPRVSSGATAIKTPEGKGKGKAVKK